MRIHLRRTDIGVAEKFLHAAQVPARLEQVSRKRVTEQVWMRLHAQAGTSRPIVDAQLNCPSTDAPAVAGHKERSFIHSRQGSTLLEPCPDGVDGESTDGQDSRFVALASDPHRAISQVDVGKIERDELLQAQA